MDSGSQAYLLINYQDESEFPCGLWFSNLKGDDMIQRTLYKKGMTKEQVEQMEREGIVSVAVKSNTPGKSCLSTLLPA
jgi:hypothetical protein